MLFINKLIKKIKIVVMLNVRKKEKLFKKKVWIFFGVIVLNINLKYKVVFVLNKIGNKNNKLIICLSIFWSRLIINSGL